MGEREKAPPRGFFIWEEFEDVVTRFIQVEAIALLEGGGTAGWVAGALAHD